MRYLFHNSNSINDFIDPVLSLVLGRSPPNETQKQAISLAWQCGGAAPEREPPPLPAGASGDAQPGPCLLPRGQATALVLPASSSSKWPGQR